MTRFSTAAPGQLHNQQSFQNKSTGWVKDFNKQQNDTGPKHFKNLNGRFFSTAANRHGRNPAVHERLTRRDAQFSSHWLTKLEAIRRGNENVTTSPQKRWSATCSPQADIYQLTGITIIDFLPPSISCFICHLRINPSAEYPPPLEQLFWTKQSIFCTGLFFFLREKQVSEKTPFI